VSSSCGELRLAVREKGDGAARHHMAWRCSYQWGDGPLDNGDLDMASDRGADRNDAFMAWVRHHGS
jgi:hypothetical protein